MNKTKNEQNRTSGMETRNRVTVTRRLGGGEEGGNEGEGTS